MNKEEFSKLSPREVEDFINGGGVVTEDISVGSVEAAVSSHTEVTPSPQVDGVGGSTPSEQLAPDSTIQFQGPNGFDIKDPVELLFLLDEDVASGKDVLYDWQIRIMLDFAAGGVTDSNPYQGIVRACNGSGKDRFILASCVVWLSMAYKNTISPVTSSSGAQLDNQTCRYIKYLCESANRKFGAVIWNCKYREYSLDFGDGSKSFIYCYATDEAKKAEGYHPARNGAKMGIFVSEDKSVPDEINVAINKCTGYTHRLHVSTPGLPMGHFYDYCSVAVNRKMIEDISTVKPEDFIEYVVTAYDCPHLKQSYIEQMKRDLPGGEFGAAFKSQVLAEFGTTDEMVVIPYTYVWQAVNSTARHIREAYNTAGLDLADGGAETVLCIRNGNKLLKTVPFRFDNTPDTIQFLEEKFRENELVHKEALIYGDCTGAGKPVLDVLKSRGWSNIRYIDSRHKAVQPKVFRNRATELFFHVRKLLEHKELIVTKDDLLIRQLSSRYYKITTDNIHQLLSKQEQRSRGYPSPDRADAFNLAFWGYKSTYNYKIDYSDTNPAPVPVDKEEPIKGDFSLKSWAKTPKHRLNLVNKGQKDFSQLEKELARYRQQLAIERN